MEQGRSSTAVSCCACKRVQIGSYQSVPKDHTVDFKKLEYWPGTIYAAAGCPSSLGFEVGEQ